MKEECITIIYNTLEEDGARLFTHELDKEDYYKSVGNVEKALEKIGYNVNKIQLRHGIGGLLSYIEELSPICIFNMCEEFNGDSWGEVYIAGILELLKIPYTGTGPMGLALSLNKAKSKDILNKYGIKVPRYKVFNLDYKKNESMDSGVKFPLIVKPLYEDGSYGIDNDSVVHNGKDLNEKIKEIHDKFSEPAIAEEYIDGRELNVSILGNGKNLKVLPISEIDYFNVPQDMPKICSYKAKWEIGSEEYKNTIPVCPAELPRRLKENIQDISIKVYNIMECRDYARIDLRLDSAQNPYIIEVNPNPCLSHDSGFVCSAVVAGMSYVELIDGILNICIERSNARYNYTEVIKRG